MKLFHKVNSQYLAFSIILMLGFGAAIYIVLSHILAEELDENLLATRQWDYTDFSIPKWI